MKILVTGTEGYLGSLLAPLLMERGHQVIGVDTGYYKVGWLYNATDRAPQTLSKDIRQLQIEDFRGVDAVVHMAELSNDPAGQLAPHVTYDINHQGSLHIARLAKAAGVERFVYTSSCSVYGLASEEFVDETSPVNPQTAYATCKTLVEKDVRPMADERFSPTFLRNATAYGASPRMRFDIVLNNLAGYAWTSSEIKMTSDGTPWRPLVHALDIAKAIICTLEAPRNIIHNQIFNVGDTAHNYQVRQVAEIVAAAFPGCQLSFGSSDGDNRSYKVSFEKINNTLPGFACEWDARRGAQQLYEVFKAIDMAAETFTFRGFTRLKQLQYLLATQQLDTSFFWTPIKKVPTASPALVVA
ncbi:MAG: SDR family oxidoreductase [Cyanobacteria bacterium J06641_5]